MKTTETGRDRFGKSFPLTGKVLIINLGLGPKLTERYRNRIHMCDQGQIQNQSHIPPFVAAVLISGKLPPLVIQRILNCALKGTVQYIAVEDDLSLFRRHLETLLEKVDLSVDPAKGPIPQETDTTPPTLASQRRNRPPRHRHPRRFWEKPYNP